MLYYQDFTQLTSEQNTMLESLQKQFKTKEIKEIQSADYIFFCFCKLRKIFQGINKSKNQLKDEIALLNQVFETQKYFSKESQKILKLEGINVKYHIEGQTQKQKQIQQKKIKQVVNSIKEEFTQFFTYLNQTFPKKNHDKLIKLFQILQEKMNVFYPIRQQFQKDLKTVKILNAYMKQLLLSIPINKKNQIERPVQQNKITQIPSKKKNAMTEKIEKLKQQLQKNDEQFFRVKGQIQNKIDIMQLNESKYEIELQRMVDVRRRSIDIWVSSN